MRSRTERAGNYQDLKSVGRKKNRSHRNGRFHLEITAKATQLPGKVVGEKENGRDSPLWIVAHSIHFGYPARHLYMQPVCQ